MNEIRTYASICVYHADMTTHEMINILEHKPSRTREKRDAKDSVCVYSTRDELNSTDLTDHLSFLFEHLKDLFEKISHDNQHGFKSSVSVFWDSPSIGGGGPRLTAEHMKFLGDHGIEMWFDIWWAPKCISPCL